MYERILVAVDGSETADLALQHAISLAQDQQAQLRIVYAVDEINLNLETEFAAQAEIVKAWIEAGRDILGKAQNRVQTAGLKAEAKLLEIDKLGYRIADVVVQEAKDWPADLLVVGTHGRRGLSHVFLGSVAESIVRICPVPVLLIRGK
ncbi:MAG: universal stress protein [Burkholderiales bacterium]